MSNQLEIWKSQTVAQYVYSLWLWHSRNMSPTKYHPMRAIEKVVKETGIPQDLVERIVGIQSRWNARRFLRKYGRKSR